MNIDEIYLNNDKLNNYGADYKGEITIYTIDINFSNRLQTVKRVYTKILDVTASMSGIMNVLSVIGKIIVTVYSSYAFDLDLINSIFKKKHIDECTFKNHYNSELKVNNIILNNNNNNYTNNDLHNLNLCNSKIEKRGKNSKLSQEETLDKNGILRTLNLTD